MIFTILISNNNGSNWVTHITGLTGFTYSWNTTIHPDGNSYMIRVRAYDEMTSGQDESDAPFTLENFEEPVPSGGGLDPMLLAIIGAGVLVVVIVLVVLLKKKGGGKTK